MSTIRARALSALRDGRVMVKHAGPLHVDGPPPTVVAFVTSSREHGERYVVDLLGDVWTCTCAAYMRRSEVCPHAAAVQLVTGHGGPAAKDAPALAQATS